VDRFERRPLPRYKSWSSAADSSVTTTEEEKPTKTPPLKPYRKRPTLHCSLSVLPPCTSSSQTIIPHNPLAGHDLLPNPLRPHVAAADRLRHWRTPYSVIFEQEVSKCLPHDAVDAIFQTIQSTHAPATKSTYGAGLLRFNQYCDEMHIPKVDRMPTPFILLVGFISTHKGKVSGGTIKSWLSTLKAWHDTWHAPWHGNDCWV
jgi:hypothetical protein